MPLSIDDHRLRNVRTGVLTALGVALTIPAIGWTASSLGAIASLGLSPTDVTTGATATGQVMLDAITKASLSVTLSSANGSLATVPSSLLIGAGKRERTFPIQTVNGATGCTTITARLESSVKQATIIVHPAATPSGSPIKVGLPNPPSVVGGMTINGNVILPSATASSVVQLSSSDPATASVPGSITVPLTSGDVVFGAANFPITTSVTGVMRCVTITATQGGATSRVLLKVVPVSG